jgi:outer membrane autotransporter protein
VFNNTIALRGGYKALGQRDSEDRFTLGAGINYPFTNSLTFKFDYGFEKFERLDTVHKFSIGVAF